MQMLQVYRTYFPDPPGGLQEAIRQISLATQPYGIDSTVFTLSPHPEPAELNRPEGTVVRSRSWLAPASCDLGGLGALKLFRALSRRADVLVFHFPWPFGDILNAVGDRDRPSVLVYHSDIVRQRFLGAMYAPLMWRSLRSMSAVIATSPAYARTSPILSHPAIRDKVRVMPLGIEEQSYPAIGDDSIFDRIHLDPNEPFFLFIGVLRYYKGLHVLLRAAKDIDAKVVIAGAGPERKRLDNHAVSLALHNVIFAGQVSDQEKVALLQHCRAVVLPSHLRSEAFGMVLVEAAMFSRPMISCELGTGTSYVNVHRQTGLVVSPENPVELAKAMETLLRDEPCAKEWGLGARSRYEQLFSAPALGRAYADLFAQLI